MLKLEQMFDHGRQFALDRVLDRTAQLFKLIGKVRPVQGGIDPVPLSTSQCRRLILGPGEEVALI